MTMITELRRAARQLFRQPGLAGLAVLALALGIGLPTAMYTLVSAAVLRGLPIEDADRLMHLERRPVGASGEGMGAAARDYLGWSEQQRSFEQLGAFSLGTATVRAGQSVDRWEAAYVTPNTFRLLGVEAAVGRAFGPEEERAGAQPAVVLANHVWRDRFAGDPGAIGSTVWVDGTAHTVVGVMPPDFRFPLGQDLWLPLVVSAGAAQDESFPTLDVFGKLRDGVGRDEAHAEFAVIAQRMAERYPDTNRNLEITVKRFTERFIGETATANMYVMLGAVLLVLLVACVNVANLLLVRAVHRTRELAILSALGATRTRVVGQVLGESAVLAIAGAVLGIGVAAAAAGALARAFAGRLPYWIDLRLDGGALLFALGLAALAALIAGLLPALRATRGELSGLLRDDSRGATGTRAGRVMRGLVVVEVALSLALLVNTGLMVRSVRQVQAVDLGFPTADVFTARIALPETYATAAERMRYYDDLERALAAEPTVGAVGLATALPATHAPFTRFAVEGTDYSDAERLPAAHYAAVSRDLFAALGVQPIRGRVFGPEDGPDALPVIVVNARFAERFLGGGDPIGRRIRLGSAEDAPWRIVVGVVQDLWMGALDSSPDRNPAGVYVPLAQSAASSVGIMARVRGGQPLALTQTVRAAAFALDRDVPLYEVRSMPQLIADNSWFYGLGAGIMGVCGLAALLLASIGLYGVISFSVGRRLREFGIRMALGADAGGILRLVVRGGSVQVVSGLVLGFALAALIARGVANLLFQVSPSDPMVFGAVGLVLVAVCLAAMLVPAARAARVDPMASLRVE